MRHWFFKRHPVPAPIRRNIQSITQLEQAFEQQRTAVDIISRSFNIIQKHTDISWRQQADVIIEPNVQSFAWDDFTKTPELVAAGEAAAMNALPEIVAALRGKKKKDSAA